MIKKILVLGIICMISMIPSIEVKAESELEIDEKYQEYVYEIAKHYEICPELILALIERESRGLSDVSSGGCKGLMQINERFHKDRMERLGVSDLYDPRGNILVGVDYIYELSVQYSDIAAVLMHYHGEKNVEERILSNNMSKYAKGILDRSAELEILRDTGRESISCNEL